MTEISFGKTDYEEAELFGGHIDFLFLKMENENIYFEFICIQRVKFCRDTRLIQGRSLIYFFLNL